MKMNSYFHGFSYDKGDDNNVICIKIPLRIWYTTESDSIQSQDTLWKAWVSRDTLSEIEKDFQGKSE